MTHTFKLACVVVLTCHVIITQQQGTTDDLRKIFKERCENYRSDMLVPAPDVNCQDLWVQFSGAWRYKDPSDDPPTYDELFRHLNQTLPRDKLLFWSERKTLAHQLSNHGRRYVTVEDTLIGSVADGLTWCGQTTGDGINYTDCPPYGLNAAEPVKKFWLDASRWFASQAVGKVRVLLNGSNPSRQAYSKDSIFYSVEFPNLKSRVVTKLTAIVVHNLGRSKIENCTSPSLVALKSDVLAKNIEFDCCANPKEVLMYLCGNSTHYRECAGLNAAVILGHFKHGSSIWARLTSATSMATLLMISFVCM